MVMSEVGGVVLKRQHGAHGKNNLQQLLSEKLYLLGNSSIEL